MLVKMGLMKRAANVNEDYPFAATIPAGTTCTGTVAGQSNVCLVKVVNPSGAGPFGGVVAIQMAGGAASSAASSVSTPSSQYVSSILISIGTRRCVRHTSDREGWQSCQRQQGYT